MKQFSNEDTRGVALLSGFFLYSLILNSIGILVSSLLESEHAIAFSMGAVLGELGVLAVWATIGPNRFWIRWPMAFAMIAIGFNIGLFSIYLLNGTSGPDIYATLRMNFMLPLVMLSAQSPLWIGRIVIGWRIRRPGRSSLNKERRFGILEIMGVMSYFGGAMALCRFVTDGDMADQALVMSLMMAVYAGMWMLMFVIPLLMGILLPTHTPGTLAVLISYFSLMLLLPLALIGFFAGSAAFAAIGGWLLFLGGCSSTFAAFLVVLKACDYLLEIRMGATSNIIESPFDEDGESPFADMKV